MKHKASLALLPLVVLWGCSGTTTSETSTPTSAPTVDFSESATTTQVEFTIDSTSGMDLSIYTPDTSAYYFVEDDHGLLKGLTFQEALKIYASDSFTGVLFYGYPTCAFCNEALPTLIDVASANGQAFYYVNVHMDGYSITDDDLASFEDYAYAYYQDDGQGGKSFYVPTVFAIKDGQILDAHTGLLDDMTIDTSEPLSAQAYEELFNIYQGLYDFVYSD